MSWIYWKIRKIYSQGILKNAIIFSFLQSELKSASYYQEMSFNMDIELTDILGSLKMTHVKHKAEQRKNNKGECRQPGGSFSPGVVTVV